MAERIILRAWVQPDHGAEKCGGTSIYINVPEGLSYHDAVHYIAGVAGGEMARYLAHECLNALGRLRTHIEADHDRLSPAGVPVPGTNPAGQTGAPAAHRTLHDAGQPIEMARPCLREIMSGTRYTWSCERCIETWVDRRSTNWRPYVCRLNGTKDAA